MVCGVFIYLKSYICSILCYGCFLGAAQSAGSNLLFMSQASSG